MSDTKSYKTLQSELDEVLMALQAGDIDLDESMRLYEQGKQLINELEKQLKAAKNKVSKLRADFTSK